MLGFTILEPMLFSTLQKYTLLEIILNLLYMKHENCAT